MVRTFLLTDVKRKLLKAYLADGTQLTGFRELKSLILHLDIERIETDLKLIKELVTHARGEIKTQGARAI